MKPRGLVFYLLVLCGFVRSVAAQSVLVFDDGGQHLVVEDQEQTALRVDRSTQLEVRSRVSIGISPDTPGIHNVAEVSNGSTLIVDGGSLQDIASESGYGLLARDSSVQLTAGQISGSIGVGLENSGLMMDGGTIEGRFQGLNLSTDATARVAGGVIRNWDDNGIGAIANANSHISLTGGVIHGLTDSFDAVGLQLNDDASLSMTGGTLSADVVIDAFSLTALEQGGNSTARVHGGHIAFVIPFEGTGPHRLVRLAENSQLDVSGGVFDLGLQDPLFSNSPTSLFELSGNSRLAVSGGTFASMNDASLHVDLAVADEAYVSIFGRDFNFPMFTPLSATDGVITGTLLDGNTLQWTFTRVPAATIILVPEPFGATLTAIGFGVMLIAIRRFRR